MDTGLIVVIVLVVLAVLLIAAVVAMRARRRKLEEQRLEAAEHRHEAEIRTASAERREAEAEERAARARHEEAQANEQAARARQDREVAEARHAAADRIDPDVDSKRDDPGQDAPDRDDEPTVRPLHVDGPETGTDRDSRTSHLPVGGSRSGDPHVGPAGVPAAPRADDSADGGGHGPAGVPDASRSAEREDQGPVGASAPANDHADGPVGVPPRSAERDERRPDGVPGDNDTPRVPTAGAAAGPHTGRDVDGDTEHDDRGPLPRAADAVGDRMPGRHDHDDAGRPGQDPPRDASLHDDAAAPSSARTAPGPVNDPAPPAREHVQTARDAAPDLDSAPRGQAPTGTTGPAGAAGPTGAAAPIGTAASTGTAVPDQSEPHRADPTGADPDRTASGSGPDDRPDRDREPEHDGESSRNPVQAIADRLRGRDR